MEFRDEDIKELREIMEEIERIAQVYTWGSDEYEFLFEILGEMEDGIR